MATPQVRIPRRKPSDKRKWRRQQVDQAPDAMAKVQAAWYWLLPGLKNQPNVLLAGEIVRYATHDLRSCQAAMDRLLPLDVREAKRRDYLRAEYAAAQTGWAQMVRAYDAVRSAASRLAAGRYAKRPDHEAWLGERERLLGDLAARLARHAERAEGGASQ
jgi:hypothetical protein